MSSLHGELQEAKKFISQATQPGIKALLQEYVLNIEQTLNKVAARSSDTATTPDSDNQTSSQQNSSSSSAAASTTTTTAPSIKQVSITSYSWDESETEVKLYLKLPSSSAPSSSSSKQSPIEKIIFSINSSTDEKSLNISFAVFFSPDKEGGNSMINSGELHSFAAHPTKHELENVLAMYEIPRQQQQQQQDSSSAATTTNNHIFCTPNSTFVYPGEHTTPGGNLLRYCRLKIKPNGDVVVGIKKVMPQIWADLIDKDDFNKPLAFGNSGGSRSRSDPGVQQSASLVSLMQQLYRDGDDEMRKTIANAWEESRSMPPPSEDDAVTIAADLQKKLAGGGGGGGNDAKNEAPGEK